MPCTYWSSLKSNRHHEIAIDILAFRLQVIGRHWLQDLVRLAQRPRGGSGNFGTEGRSFLFPPAHRLRPSARWRRFARRIAHARRGNRHARRWFPGRHDAAAGVVLDRSRPGLRLRVGFQREGRDFALPVADDAVVEENWSHVAGIRGGHCRGEFGAGLSRKMAQPKGRVRGVFTGWPASSASSAFLTSCCPTLARSRWSSMRPR